MDNSKVTIHMVSSLDGFIANKDNSVDWMESRDHYEKGQSLTEEDIANYLKGIDCYVMGANTYEHALKLGWPYGEVPVFVVTSRKFSIERKSVQLSNLKPSVLIDELKQNFANIWMVGGTQMTKTFLQRKLADEIIVSIIPILLGGGKPYFDAIDMEQELHLSDVTAYKDGMVELTYKIKNLP